MTTKNIYDEGPNAQMKLSDPKQLEQLEKEFEQDVYKEFEFGFNKFGFVFEPS